MTQQEISRHAKAEAAKFKTGDQTPRTLVTELSQLQEGDHIMWKRFYFVFHHAIVTSVNLKAEKFKVIEYTGRPEYVVKERSLKAKAKIEENEYVFAGEDDHLYKVLYDPGLCFSPEETVKKAESRINEKKYNAFKKNCEHFARWCKTGHEWCTQTARAAREALTWGAKAGGKLLAGVGESAAFSALSTAGQGAKAIGKQMLREATKGGVKTLGRRVAVGVIGGAASVLAEGISFGVDYYRASKSMKNRNIDKDEFNREVARSGCKSLGSVIGGVAGAVCGSLIPVPGMGFVLGAVGSAVGSVLGGLARRLPRSISRFSRFLFGN